MKIIMRAKKYFRKGNLLKLAPKKKRIFWTEEALKPIIDLSDSKTGKKLRLRAYWAGVGERTGI